MKRQTIKRIAGVLAIALLLSYAAQLFINRGNDTPMTTQDYSTSHHRTVAIFGATGTIGDGLLKAAINDPDVDIVRVFTRRPSKRIEEGVAAGKVEMIIHKDYLDYAPVLEDLADVDAVFWAIGLSAVGLDEDTYREIHVDYPMTFVTDWLQVSTQEEISFHYVSGSGAKTGSRMMWAREKARAESELTNRAAGSKLRVVSYRPAVILPTETEAHLRHRIGYAILAPIKSAVAAESIGDAMIEVSARGRQYANGTILENKAIIGLARQRRHPDS